MSQDWAVEEIAPGTTSPAVDVVKITDALLALKSKFSGASLPTANLYGGMEVVLTSGARYFRNAANDAWLYAGRVDEYSRGSIAMHATTMDIWGKPNIMDGTGSAVPITAIANAPQAGAVRIVYPPAGTVITHGATFSVQGGASYTTAAGDALVIEAVTTSTYNVWVLKKSEDVGKVSIFAMDTAPAGYLKANGALVSRATYAALFATIGTVFGVGDGATTFALPDLRGEFLRGWDDGRGIDSGRVFGSAQADAFKAHVHTDNCVGQAGGNGGIGPGSPEGIVGGNTGSTGDTETRPRNIALLACIKF